MSVPRSIDSSSLRKGPLTEEEFKNRMTHLISIIDGGAANEIKTIESSESSEDAPRELVLEPKDAIDEWVEKLRAYTERYTAVFCARLRRVAKLQILEALSNLRNVVKDGAKDQIRDIMSRADGKGAEILREMLLQGVLRLLEPVVLVHATKNDLPKIKQHYPWVIKMYEEATKAELQLVTSQHLRRKYVGKIVLTDSNYTIFVDVNLYTTVDHVVDRVFTQYAAENGKFTSSLNFAMVDLKESGLKIMPRGVHVTQTKLDAVLSNMHGDPRTQAPSCQLNEDTYKQVTHEQKSSRPKEHDHDHDQEKQTKKKTGFDAPQIRLSVTQIEPALLSPLPPKYARHEESDIAQLKVHNKDLYNLENASSAELHADMDSKSMPSRPSNAFRLPRNTVSPKLRHHQSEMEEDTNDENHQRNKPK